MIYKEISCKDIIARVYRDLNARGDDRWVDMIEWIGDALDKIGTYTQLKHRVCRLDIEDYKTKLPEDLYSLNQIYYNGYPLRVNTGTFYNYLLTYKSPAKDTTSPITEESLEGIPGFLSATAPNQYNQDVCTIDPCYLKTSFKTGTVYISYNAFPLDEDGFPLIPDNAMFKEACFWYIAMQLCLPDWFSGKSSRYEEARDKWNFYCKAAAAAANSPDITRLENIKNQWVRLLPNINRGSSFFIDLNKQENLNI